MRSQSRPGCFCTKFAAPVFKNFTGSFWRNYTGKMSAMYEEWDFCCPSRDLKLCLEFMYNMSHFVKAQGPKSAVVIEDSKWFQRWTHSWTWYYSISSVAFKRPSFWCGSDICFASGRYLNITLQPSENQHRGLLSYGIKRCNQLLVQKATLQLKVNQHPTILLENGLLSSPSLMRTYLLTTTTDS